MSGKSFSVWLNHEYLPGSPDYGWIKEVSSKSVKKSIEDGDTAFKKFFKGQSRFPKFKKKGKSDVKMYFVRNNPKDCSCERHRIKIPTLGWVRLKEKGYIPTSKDGYVIRSGTVSVRVGRYYVSVLVEIPDTERIGHFHDGIGENLKKGEYTQRANIQKQKRKVQKLHQRIDHIRMDYVNQTIAGIVKTKPSHITIEDLNVSGMMKNRHLSKAVASQKFSEFRRKLKYKCDENGIELRIVDRFYPSSKLCHCCGRINKGLKLSDRIYKCDCGYVEDRDLNAALNLRDAKIYKVT